MKGVVLTFVVSSLVLFEAYASCNPDAIIYSRNISFDSENFSFTGANNLNISVPVQYRNERGCWNQQSEMKFNVVVDEKNNYGEASVVLPKSKFEYLSEGRTDTYLIVEDAQNQMRDVQFSTVSFTCVGQSVLSVESYSGNFEKLNNLQKLRTSGALNVKFGTSTIFATGQAVQNLAPVFERRRELFLMPQRLYGYDTKVSDRFSDLVETRMGDHALREFDDGSVIIPSIYISSQVSYNSSSVSQNFSTVKIGKYGCSNQLRKAMEAYRIDKIPSAGQIVGKAKIKYDSSKNKIDITWGEKPKKKGLFGLF